MTDTLEHPAPAPGSPGDVPGADQADAKADATVGGWKALLSMAAILGLFALAAVSWGVWALVIIVGLIVSIVLHELGHFLAAKRAGMKVTEFFLGFGPRLWSFRRGETEYGVKPIWAGAYVRIVGMNNLEEVDPADEGSTYREKGYWSRLSVVLAGPFMNLAIAFVLLFALFAGFGMTDSSNWRIREALPGSAAAAAGVQADDHVVSLAGEPIGSFEEFGDVITANAGRQVDLVVERDGEQVTLQPTIRWALDADAAAAVPPLEPGDRVTAVDGQPVTNYEDLVRLVPSDQGTVPIEFERSGYLYDTQITTPAPLPAEGAKGFLGVRSGAVTDRQGPVEAAGSAAGEFGSMVTSSVGSIGKFFSPSGLGRYTELVLSTPPQGVEEASATPQAAIVPVDPSSPPAEAASAGPSAADQSRVLSLLGVVRLGGQAGETGPQAVFLLLALVNLFLGLINLVPLLPFDGGHAAVATYEAIRGRIAGHPYRADVAKLMPIAYVVIAMFGFIGLTSIYLDAVKTGREPVRSMTFTRRKTRQIMVGSVPVGGDAPITVQSMTTTKTADVEGTLAQIYALAAAGADIVRCTCNEREAAEGLAAIVPRSPVPIIADIHHQYRRALEALDAGVACLRLNPGNIRKPDHIKLVARECKDRGVPIRIGVNGGSLDPELYDKYGGTVTPEAMVESAERELDYFREVDFDDVKISVKASNVPIMIEAYRQLSDAVDYPLHLGVTEAGPLPGGLVKATAGIATLLSEGIGDTIRYSLTADPVEEARAGRQLLEALGLRERKGLDLIACPSCGRAEVDVIEVAHAAEEALTELAIPIQVAVMGCVVNGPGEAREADLGIAAGRKRGHLFVKGKVVKVVPEDGMVEALVEWARIIDEGGVDEALARADAGAAAEAEADRVALLDEQGADANDVGTKVELMRKHRAEAGDSA